MASTVDARPVQANALDRVCQHQLGPIVIERDCGRPMNNPEYERIFQMQRIHAGRGEPYESEMPESALADLRCNMSAGDVIREVEVENERHFARVEDLNGSG